MHFRLSMASEECNPVRKPAPGALRKQRKVAEGEWMKGIEPSRAATLAAAGAALLPGKDVVRSGAASTVGTVTLVAQRAILANRKGRHADGGGIGSLEVGVGQIGDP